MIARLVIYLVIYAVPVALATWGLYRAFVRPRLIESRARRAAALNESHECGDCDLTVDINDASSRYVNGRWYHKKCIKNLLSSL